jgi:hypothetical protein
MQQAIYPAPARPWWDVAPFVDPRVAICRVFDDVKHSALELQAQGDRMTAELARLRERGQSEQAAEYGLQEGVRIRLALMAQCGRFEEAILVGLGERRRPEESYDDFGARIDYVLADLGRTLAMRRHNGVGRPA